VEPIVVEVGECGITTHAECLDQPRMFDERVISRFEGAKRKTLEVWLLTEPIRCRLVERREDDRDIYATVPAGPSGKPLGIAVGPEGESIAHEYGTRILVSEEAMAFFREAMRTGSATTTSARA
jgi:hypothetical protein